MKQVIQSYKTGKISLDEVPLPLCRAGGVLVRNANSLISIGTEKSMIDIAKKSLLGKAKARPDLVKRFIDKAKKEGLFSVYKEAMNRLDEPVALGYSSAGVVLEAGAGVTEFKRGDRVACVGAGFASHAEVVWIPENLCIALPDNVDFDEASFVMLGGIALEGIRQADLTFGEKTAVIGLGLLGLLSVQMLQAYGCEVIGIDIDSEKVKLAQELGLTAGLVAGKEDVISCIDNLTCHQGVDAVVITSASKDNAPIEMAENISRKKGKIVLVGVADISLTRKTFWEKELSFTVSKAAGPGSIEPVYEQAGYDYPIRYVRWTEKRNLEQVVSLLSKKKLNVRRLVTHSFTIENALAAYEMILSGRERCIGVLLEYPKGETLANDTAFSSRIVFSQEGLSAGRGGIGVIGGGLFTKNILLPALAKVPNAVLRGIATTTGATSYHIGKRYGFSYCTSEYRKILEDSEVKSVIITTRHNLHAKMAKEALLAGKHVYVEKPLCVTEEELKELVEAYSQASRKGLKLMVGFNRRYSSLSLKAKELFGKKSSPLVMLYRVNAGYIPADHWTQDKNVGGGRIIGEVCHFVDFLQFICGSLPVSIFSESISGKTGKYLTDDNVSLTIKFVDGSLGTIIYAACGSSAFSREKVEVFGEERVLTIDDFKKATVIRAGKQKSIKKMSQDMGYASELDYFVNSKEFDSDTLFKGYVATTLATIRGLRSFQTGAPVVIDSAV